MADSVNLADEFAPPDTKATAPIDIAGEFDPPPLHEQHAVINDAADKAHQWKTAKTSADRLALVTDWFSQKGIDATIKNAGEFVAHNWEKENEPLLQVPKVPSNPAVEALSASNPQFRVLAGVYNGLAPIASSLTSPLNVETLGTFGALQKASQLVGPAGTAAKAALNSIKLYFGAQMAKGAGEAAGAASVDPSIENVTTALASTGLAILGGHAAVEGLAGKEAVTPAAEQPVPANPEPIAASKPVEAPPAPPAPETVATAAVKLADGTVHTGKTHGQIVGELGDADLTGADDGFVTSTGRYVTREEGMKIAKASAQMDNSNQGPEKLYSEHLDENQSRPPMKVPEPLEQATKVAGMSANQFTEWAGKQPDGITAEAQKAGNEAADHPEAITQLRQHLTDAQTEAKAELEKFTAGDEAAGDTASALASKVQFFREALEVVDKPNLTKEFTPPAEGSQEHAAITEELAQPPEPPADLTKEVTPPEGGPTGIKNAIVDHERQARGLPPAMEAGKHAFGEAWDEASAKLNKNPNAGFELVKDLNEHPRAIGDTEDALLLRHQIDLQNQFDKLAERITEGSEGQTAESLAEDKTHLALLSDSLVEAYDANRKAGTETGRGLNARKMLANEDFSLAKMVTKSRAGKGGRALNADEMAEVMALHEKIAETQKAFDEYVAKNPANRRTARPAAPARNAVSQFISDRATEARKRIYARRAEGRVQAGLDPVDLLDHATIGAEYIAKGLEKFADWSTEMVKEFGERIQPHLKDIFAKAQEVYEESTLNTVLAARKARLEKSIADLNAKLETGDLSTSGQKMNRPLPEDLEKLQLQRDEAKAKLEELRKTATEPTAEEMLKSKVESLNERIAERKAALESGDLAPEPTVVNRPLPPELEQAKQELEAVNRQIEEARKGTPRTPEEIRLAATKNRLENSTEDYEARLANEDFSPQEKPTPVRLDEEGLRLKAANERAKQDFQTALIRDQLENRTAFEKAQDTFVKWRRGFLLSGPITLAKLTAAAVERGVFTPIEEAVGTVLPSALKANAPRQGGFSVKAEAKAITSSFTKGMADAAQTLKTGKSDLDVLYGHGPSGNVRVSDVIPRSMIDYFGSLHGALKAPIKRAEFERSLEKRTEYAIRQGVDVSDPMVQTRLSVEAYKDANRAIFMQDNVVTNAWNAGLRLLEAKQKATGQPSVPGKLISTTLRTLLPIVKVPTNIVAETFETATGFVTGSIKLAVALRKGLENLPPEQSDVIARELKKGSLGAAVIALGYFNADKVGGYYQQGEKRKPTDAKAGSILVFGHNVPSFLLHNPLLETLQLGATIRRVAEAKVKGAKNGLATGVWTGALGLTEELPFVRTPIELAKVFDPKERTYAEGELAKSFLVPQALDYVARETDTKANGEPQKRKPATVLQHVETGIPGLRQTVPKRN